MLQTKINPLAQCQLKFANDGDWKIEGYLSVFNSDDKVGDTILPGAYSKSISRTDTYPFFVNHAHKDIPVGSMKVKEDAVGLWTSADVNPDHFMGKTAYSAAKRGDITGFSIGFELDPSGYEKKSSGRGRIISEVILKEGSLVTFPCEELAKVFAVKSDIEQCETIRDLEHSLRDSWLGEKSAAIAWMGRYRDLLMRDSEEKSREITEQQVVDHVRHLLTELGSKIR